MTPQETLILQKHLSAENRPRLVYKSKVPFPDGFHAFISLTNETIKAGSWEGLLIVWAKYQKLKGINLPDPHRYLEEAVCIALQRERGNWTGYCERPVRQSNENQIIDQLRYDTRGPTGLRAGTRGKDAMAWKALHLAAIDGKLTPALVTTFGSRIGCGTCKSDWRTTLRNNPPVYSPDQRNAFDWTVKVHNIVNKKIGKPQMDAGAAWTLWNSHPLGDA